MIPRSRLGWLTSVGVGAPAGGTVNRCNPRTGWCSVAWSGSDRLTGLPFPAALTFDTRGNGWLLENNLIGPTVRRLELH